MAAREVINPPQLLVVLALDAAVGSVVVELVAVAVAVAVVGVPFSPLLTGFSGLSGLSGFAGLEGFTGTAVETGAGATVDVEEPKSENKEQMLNWCTTSHRNFEDISNLANYPEKTFNVCKKICQQKQRTARTSHKEQRVIRYGTSVVITSDCTFFSLLSSRVCRTKNE